MKQLKPMVFMTALALMALLGAPALSLAQETHFAALDAINEVPTCFSSGEGTFTATIAEGDTAIDYELSYEGLFGTVTQAHIHFGKPFEQGGIVVFLCSNLANPPADLPADTPACPPSGTVTGTLDASSVIATAARHRASTPETLRSCWSRSVSAMVLPMPTCIPPFVPAVRFADRSTSEVGDPPSPSHLHGLTISVATYCAVASMPGGGSGPQRSGTQIVRVVPVVNLDHLSPTD